MASNSNNFPENLLIEILCRLPVESVLRCMCVCKTWHHLIITPFFLTIHLNYQKASSNTNKYILYQDFRLCALLSDSEKLFDFTKPSKLYYTPQSFGTHVPRLHVYGVCDGLLCLSGSPYKIGNDIHLCNPICRKAKKLPKLEISSINAHLTRNVCGVTFGYYDDDYKVIVIAYVENTYIVSVYSLSANTWNIIHTNLYDKDAGIFYIGAAKFVKGTAYMMIWAHPRVIICFELTNKTIRVIKFPEELCLTLRGGVKIEAYRETIALLTCDEKYLTMWILRDKSSSTSPNWEKKFSVGLQESDHKAVAVGFLNNGKYLVRTCDIAEKLCVARLFWCDLEFPKLTEFRSVGLTEPRDAIYVPHIHSNCTESLLLLNEDSLDPFVHLEIESSCSSILFTLIRGTKPRNETTLVLDRVA